MIEYESMKKSLTSTKQSIKWCLRMVKSLNSWWECSTISISKVGPCHPFMSKRRKFNFQQKAIMLSPWTRCNKSLIDVILSWNKQVKLFLKALKNPQVMIVISISMAIVALLSYQIKLQRWRLSLLKDRSEAPLKIQRLNKSSSIQLEQAVHRTVRGG